MTTSNFDGSTPSAEPWTPTPQVQPSDAEPEFAMDSLLDQLRDEVAERDESTAKLWYHRIKSTSFRIVCDPDIDNEVYQRWVKASMPKSKGRRRSSGLAVTDMDQLALSARALIGSNVGLEVLVRGTTDEWRPVTAPNSTEQIAVDSPELCAIFGVVDPLSLLRKLFGRDAVLIDVGQDLLAAAGYLGDDDEDDDEADPTVSARSAVSARKH